MTESSGLTRYPPRNPRNPHKHSEPRPPGRLGQLIGALVNATMLWLVNVSPGWREVPFLTEEFTQVLPVVNLSMAVGLAANLGFLLISRPRVQALGGLVTSAVGLVAAWQILQVFPFDLDQPYSTIARVLLIIAVIGSAIAIVTNLVAFLGAKRKV